MTGSLNNPTNDDVKTFLKFLENLKEILEDFDDYDIVINLYEKINQLWIISTQIAELLNRCEKIAELAKRVKITTKLDTYFPRIRSKLTELNELLASYGTPENIWLELQKDKTGELFKVVDELYDILSTMQDELNKIKRNTKQLSIVFQGRKGDDLRKYSEQLREKTTQVIDDINKITDYFGDILSLQGAYPYRTIVGTYDVMYTATQLKAAVDERVKGLWSWQLIEILTGLKSVSGEPNIENIHFVLEEENPEEPSIYSIDEIFYRYPPFEPIAERRKVRVGNQVTVPISGCYLWFVKCKNVYFQTTRIFEKFWKNKQIIDGKTETHETYQEIREVKPINVLEVGNGEIEVKFTGDRYIKIKYGSRRLVEELNKLAKKLGNADENTLIKTLQKQYEREIGKIGKAYKVNDLTYVWYCRLGYAMSTDPWDFKDCPFRSECRVGRMIEGEKCKYWSFSRRIFPKVFTVTERKIFGLKKLDSTDSIGVFTPVFGTGVNIQELHKGLQWYMPTEFGEGIIAFAEFEKPIVKSLPRTNVVGFSIPYTVVKALITELIDPDITPKPQILLGNDLSQTLDELLLSKYFVWVSTQRGSRTFSFFSKRKDEIIKRYEEFKKDVYKDEKEFNNVVEFGIENLTHTLAHLLWSYLSKELEVEYRDLMYLYHIDRESDRIYILVAENSPFGVIDIVSHVRKKFGGIKEMVESFRKEITNVLRKHELELKTDLDDVKKAFSRYLQTETGKKFGEFVNELNKYYKDFIEKGLILDIHAFSLHLLLSEAYSQMAKQLKLDDHDILKELENILQFLGVAYCMDGCTACILVESGCTTPLAQNLEVSRNLTLWFLKTFFEGESLTAKGQRFGESLLRTLPEKSVFIVTPYLDKKGAKLLKEITSKGVNLTIVTRRQTYLEHKDTLDNAQVFLFTTPRHEKIYIIDDRILVDTTWNLTLSSSSTNRFEIKLLDSQEITHIKNQILLNSKKI